MKKSPPLKRLKNGTVIVDVRALQRAIELGELTAGDRVDVIESFPELQRAIEWCESVVQHRSKNISELPRQQFERLWPHVPPLK